MLDTGKCSQESLPTLQVQQQELLEGLRLVQMFPLGTVEIELPFGFARHENSRGVFHFNPGEISSNVIDHFSFKGQENVFLRLGPYSKADIEERLKNGEDLLFVIEYTPDYVEVRSAAGTNKTIDEQRQYFMRTKKPDNTVVTGSIPPERVLEQVRKAN